MNEKRLLEILNRKAEIRLGLDGATPDQLDAFERELDELEIEERQLNQRMNLAGRCTPMEGGHDDPVGADGDSPIEARAKHFRETGRMSIPMFHQERALLASGKIAKPTAVPNDVGELPDGVSSIVDDITWIDATGTGTWRLPYEKTKAAAADRTTDGSAYAGTGATYDYVDVSAADWGVLDSISKNVARQSPVAYMNAVQSASLLALREKADAKIIAAVLGSTLIQKRTSVALDEKFLRNIVLNYKVSRKIPGVPVLYINRTDLTTLGDLYGANEKTPVYEISMDADQMNGTISKGATTVRFSVDDNLTTGQQLYGKPATIKGLMWGDYEINTDQGGKYFDAGLIGILADCQANAALAVQNGMQLIKQAAS